MWLIIFTILVTSTYGQIVSDEDDKCSRNYVCPPEYLRLSQNCYFFSKTKSAWQQAFFKCKDLGGKFAIIRNAHQDKMLRSFLNKVSIVNEDRWIGGMYDWEQMMWKWSASGKEIKYKGFSRMEPQDKERLQWHCIVLDPALQYKWNTRGCLEEKYFICQTHLRKVVKTEKRKQNFEKYNRLNEIPLPDVDQNVTNLKEHRPNGINLQNIKDDDGAAFANRTAVATRKKKKKFQNQLPQLKYGKRNRRNKSKEEKESASSSIENIQTQVYYGGSPRSPLHPRILTEELSFP